MKTHQRKNRLWWMGLGVVAVMATATATWFTVGPTSSEGSHGHDKSPAQSSESSSPATLDPACQGRADPPSNTSIAVSDKSVTISGSKTTFQFYLRHDAELVAAHVGFTLRFTQNGHDVTDDLGKEFLDDWSHPWATVSPGVLRDVSADDLATPDGWKDGEVELEVDVGEPEYWCTPKEDKDP